MSMSFAPIALDARNPGPMTGAGNNTYLIASAGDALLIDAGVGHPGHVAALAQALVETQTTLGRVIVTHGHTDHASGAPTLAPLHPAAAFLKHVGSASSVEYGVEWHPIDEGDRLEIGDTTLTVLHTPGHSPDHLALWHEPSRSIFSGDLVIPGRSVMIDVSRGGRLSDYMASLERLLELEPRQLFPAHGRRVDDPRAAISAHLEHRRDRERQVVAALAAGHRTVEAIAESIYDVLDPRLMAAARENVRAHLEKLRADGMAANLDGGWTL